MIVGVPKEIKDGEFRVSIVPSGVERLTAKGHKVVIETNAGVASGIKDEDYAKVGAEIVSSMEEVYDKADLILKVKEILPPEYELLKENQIIFTYIHSANRPKETQVLLDKKVVAFAYEDVMNEKGETFLLTPMSELAGEVGLLMGVYHLFNTNGGNGMLIGGAPGIEPAKVVIFGAGHVGVGAAKYALGLGADVTLMDVNIERMREIEKTILPRVKTLYSNSYNVKKILPETDLVINAVKWSPGLTIISRDMLKLMKPNSLIVDVDCEPNGAIETCRYSTHSDPVYVVDGIRHFCVPNLPSAVSRTASYALANATIPYVLEIANKGWIGAAKENKALRYGLDFVKGHLTFKPTADEQNRPYISAEEVLKVLDR